MASCPWCGPVVDSEPDPTTLCRTHAAEYFGLTVAELDRADQEAAADIDAYAYDAWSAYDHLYAAFA